MRTIKFRAWDKEQKCILNWDELDEMMMNEDRLCFDNPDFELMQFTGLTDKNGIEIYEGDILSMHNGQYESVVKYEAPEYYCDHIGNGGREAITTWIESHEVVGNIYEGKKG